MAYQVLARKWRPQTFAEVVGQEHISRTLRNAIVQNRIGHAYLFVGSRGIGKTTTARIFAKALNCEHNIDGEPCCQCRSCLEVAAGTSMDVIEIDGASHNKVEHIRDIRENVQYAPVNGRYKVYIIDEVHMLTTQAWNALLKTLEEPPEHVKFLFATTEPHKVLPTIISRCQRFDLKRIAVPLIVQRLRQIADGEHIHVEDNALAAIARAADGGMRDAQSIFDQMIAFCGGLGDNELITEQDVIDVFGLASGMELREMAAALFTNDINRAMVVLQALADSGRDLERLFGDLINYVRNIMVAGVCREPEKFLEVSETELADLVNIGRSVDAPLVQRILQGLVGQEWTFRTAVNKRIYFESVLARVMLEAHSVQLDDIMSRLNVISGALPPEQMPAVRPAISIPPPEGFSVHLPERKAAPVASMPVALDEKAPDPPCEGVTESPSAVVAERIPASASAVSDPVAVSPAEVLEDNRPLQAESAPAQDFCSSEPSDSASASQDEEEFAIPTDSQLEAANAMLTMDQDAVFELNNEVTPESEADMGMSVMSFLPVDDGHVQSGSGVEDVASHLQDDLREPSVQEMEQIRQEPFVKKVNDLFGTRVFFARKKKE